MENSSISRFLTKQLVPDETIIYQSPRKWSALVDPIFSLVLALLLGFGYFFLSIWLQNLLTMMKEFPGFASQVNIDTAWVINVVRLGLQILACLLLITSLLRIAVFAGAETTLTDRRILGKTGRFILRKVNIPYEAITWVDFPNRIFSKGPISIQTRNGKNTILWNISKLEIFLGLLEKRYTTGNIPVINRTTSWAGVVSLLLGLVLIGVGGYAIYYAQNLDRSTPAASVSTQEAFVDTAVTSQSREAALPTQTARPTLTPKPAPVEVDFMSIYDTPLYTQIVIVGQFLLPSSTHCDNDCGIFLRNPSLYSDKIPIFLYIPLEGNTPMPNQMARLPDPYYDKDFQVRLNDGSSVGNYATVRITGVICETTDGKIAICEISNIEKE